MQIFNEPIRAKPTVCPPYRQTILSDRIRNMAGPQIRKLRHARGWSQARLVLQLQLDGLEVSREILAQMECQLHCIKDKHIFHFASVLEAESVFLSQ